MMKINFLTLLLLANMSCLSQQNVVNNENLSSIKNQNDITNEFFTDFITLFSQDSLFQCSRIIFPFKDCSVAPSGDSLCLKVKDTDWHHLSLIEDGIISSISNKFIIPNYNEGNEKVFSISNIENGTGSYYYFEIHEKKWYLIRRLSYE